MLLVLLSNITSAKTLMLELSPLLPLKPMWLILDGKAPFMTIKLLVPLVNLLTSRPSKSLLLTV